MKKTLFITTLVTICHPSIADTLTTSSTLFQGSYQNININAVDRTDIIVVKADKNSDCKLFTTDLKGKERVSNSKLTLQYNNVAGSSLVPYCGDNVTANTVQFNFIGNWKEKFQDDFQYSDAIYNPNTVSALQIVRSTNLKQKIGTELNPKGVEVAVNASYSRALLIGYLEGIGIKAAKNATFGLPANIKSNGNYLFDTFATDVSEDGKVVVGYMKARFDVVSTKGQVIFSKNDTIPLYWRIKAESKNSCNSACRNGEEIHISVGQANYIANGKRRSDVKATDSNGELLDWFQVSDGLAEVRGITKNGNDGYVAFGSDINGNAAVVNIN
jgi:hypothetical protein